MKGGSVHEVSLVRLYGLRAMYLLIAAGLAATVWLGLLHGSVTGR